MATTAHGTAVEAGLYRLPLETLRLALQTPPHATERAGVQVLHLTARRMGMASEVLAEQLGIPQDMVLRLIWFGAVYYCPVVPLPQRERAPAMSQQQQDSIMAARKRGLQRWGNDSKLQTPQRLSADVELQEGGYVRAHMHPKRFPAAHGTAWPSRLIHAGQDFVVVNKPPGLQVPPTVDNVQESLLACTEQALGLGPGALLPAHRLDAGTEGIVVMARTAAFADYFRGLMGDKAVHAVCKQYRCLVRQPLPRTGRLVHHVLENQREAGETAHTAVVPETTPGCQRCELHVNSVCEVALTGHAAQKWGPTACEVDITLVTGRTHQIRVQLAAEGCPLLGDLLYGNKRAPPPDGAAWCKAAQDNPLAPLALQAHTLTVMEDGPMGPNPATFSAGDPWWRR